MWLVTGGAGYIGSHVVLKMKEAGFEVLILDNLSSGLTERIPVGVKLIKGDICDFDLVSKILLENKIEGIINLAALKSVPRLPFSSINLSTSLSASNLDSP